MFADIELAAAKASLQWREEQRQELAKADCTPVPTSINGHEVKPGYEAPPDSYDEWLSRKRHKSLPTLGTIDDLHNLCEQRRKGIG